MAIEQQTVAPRCTASARVTSSNGPRIFPPNVIAAICSSWPKATYVQPIKWRRRRRLVERNQFSDRLTFAKRCHSLPPTSGLQLANRQHRHMRHHARLATCRHSRPRIMATIPCDVRFTPISGHGRLAPECLLCANSRPSGWPQKRVGVEIYSAEKCTVCHVLTLDFDQLMIRLPTSMWPASGRRV